MRYRHIFFDLDGTLAESGPGIMESARYAMLRMGFDPGDMDLSFLIGPPMRESLRKVCAFSEAEAEEGLRHYRSYYWEKGMYASSLYPGIEALLARLTQEGALLFVATSKIETHAVKMLQYLGVAGYFSLIGGADAQGGSGRKAEVLRGALARYPLPEPSSAILVGDTRYDALGAHEAGMPCLGVLYGYGGRSSLEEAGADFLVEDVQALGEFLLGAR